MIKVDDKKENEKQHFELPSTLIDHKTFTDFLELQPKYVDKKQQILELLLGSKYAVSALNSAMLTITQKPKFETWDIPETWESLFNNERCIYEINRAFEKLRLISSLGNTIYPLEKDIFKAFELCKRTNLKVVIIGIEPYNSFDDVVGLPMTNGLAFSARKGGKKPSYVDNIFNEIKRTFPGIPLNHYDLTSWAEQGVLLLNTSLTVNHGDPLSHIKDQVWKYFTDYIIKTISDENPGVIFCLWGPKAKIYANGSTNMISRNKSIVLECGHPSYTGTIGDSKFFENNHFAIIYHIINNRNEEIHKKNLKLQSERSNNFLPYIEQINWSLI
jgi:uracil-DNA glycosylase